MLVQEIKNKIEYYCVYQERCHEEVKQKLKSLKLSDLEIDEYIVHLIENNFLNEQRFACAFSRGKFNIKKWGKIRIKNELKIRNISKYNIEQGLKEIQETDYLSSFHELAEKIWDSIAESNYQKKKKKFCDYLLRKGWENNLVFDKLNELETIGSRQ
jgi:regulatory protein